MRICCDHCGDEPDDICVVPELPVGVTSANEGESAFLCRECHQAVKDCADTVIPALLKLHRFAYRHGPSIGQGEEP
jgi:hypothetical protein